MTTRWMCNLLLTALSFVIIGALAVPAAAVEPAAGTNTIESRELETLARDARTPAEHAKVARNYRMQAEALDAKAIRHEAEARTLSEKANRHPLSSKWPAMTRNAAAQERHAAMQARRAAKESSDLAGRHIRSAVEAELAE